MKSFFTLLFSFLCFAMVMAQDINPFESIGKEGKIITLSKGKYLEIENNDSLQRIGSVIVDMYTGEIYELLDSDTLYQESDLSPTIITRWWSVDPLSAKYPSMSPYNSFGNNPILYVDPDGMDIIDFLTVMKASYKRQQAVLTASNVFSNWLQQYANTSGKKDTDSKALGYSSGSRSNINLRFQLIDESQGLAGSSAIMFNGKPLGEASVSDLNGAKASNFELVISLSNKLDNSTSGVNAGDKLLTVLHETGLHGETQSLLLIDFLNGSISAEQFQQKYAESVKAGGEPDHMKITSGKGAIYESMVTDATSTLKTNSSLNVPYSDMVPEKKGYPRANELQKEYGKYASGTRTFSNKAVFLLESFLKAYNDDKNFNYNPEHRCRIYNHLDKSDCD